MRVGELAKATGVSPDAIRLYESLGLIRAVRRPNGYREFPEDARTVVELVRLGRRLGFSLGEIGEVLRGLSGSLSADEVTVLLTAKLADVDRQIGELTMLRGLLETRLRDVCALNLGASQTSARREAVRSSPRRPAPARAARATRTRAS